MVQMQTQICQTNLHILWRKDVVTNVTPQRRGEEVRDAEGEECQTNPRHRQLKLLQVDLETRLQQPWKCSLHFPAKRDKFNSSNEERLTLNRCSEDRPWQGEDHIEVLQEWQDL